MVEQFGVEMDCKEVFILCNEEGLCQGCKCLVYVQPLFLLLLIGAVTNMS